MALVIVVLVVLYMVHAHFQKRFVSSVPWFDVEDHTIGIHFSCPASSRVVIFAHAFGCAQKENGWGLAGVRVVPTDAKTATEWIDHENKKGDPKVPIIALAERSIDGEAAVITYMANAYEMPVIDPSRWQKTTYVVHGGYLFSIESRFNDTNDARFLRSFGFVSE